MKISLITGINGQDGSYFGRTAVEKGLSCIRVGKKKLFNNYTKNRSYLQSF